MSDSSFFNKKSELKPEDLVDLVLPSAVRISPCGTHLIYSAAPHGKKEEHLKTTLYLGEVGKEHSARQFTSGTYNDRSPAWCPKDNKCFAYLSDRGEVGKSCAIYVAHIDGGEPYAVTAADNKREISAFAWSPNGKFIAYLSADEKTPEQEKKEKDKDDVEVYGEDVPYDRLRLLNVSTKEVMVIYSENEHVQNLCWSPCGMKVAVMTSQMPDIDSPCRDGSDLKIIDLLSKNVMSSLHLPGVFRSAPCWIKDDIYFTAGVTPSATATSLAVYKTRVTTDASTMSYKRYAHGIKDCAYSIKQCGADHLIAFVQAGLRDEIEDVINGKTLYSAEQQIEGFGASFDVHFSDGKTSIALVTSSTSTPPEVYTKSFVRDDITEISNHGAHLSSHPFGKYTAIRCRSFDDAVTLEGYYVTPSNHSKGPLPTFVCIHGGPYMRNTRGFDGSSWGQTPYLLNTVKCGILIPNYRGNSSQGEDFAKPARGFVGTVEYDDILRLVQKGIDQNLIDPDNIIVGGWSQGGFLSYLSAVRNGAEKLPDGAPKTWRFKGAIAGAGVTDWDMMSMTSDSTTFESECAGAAPWTSEKSSVVARKGSAIWEFKAAAEQKAVPPMLILHGKEDGRVPVSQAWAFQKACREYGVPCEMAVYPREPHGVRERAHQIDMLKRCKRFCDMHFS